MAEVNPIYAQRRADMIDTYKHFALQKVREENPNPNIYDKPAVDAFNKIHEELRKLKPLKVERPNDDDDVEWVFREWADQWPEAKTRKDIGIALGADPNHFFPEGITYGNEREWQDAHNEQGGLFVATMQYFATGEGMTYQIIAKTAGSLPEFILEVGAEVGGHYFVQGMDFHRGVPEPGVDPIFDRFVNEAGRAMLDPRGHVSTNLCFHVNYS